MADEPGMDKAELRKLLTIAKKAPVNVALGMMKDGTPAILMHKVKQPRALSKELESGGAELKNMRWGEFLVEEEGDPKTLVARLNKPASGLARKLVKAVKFAGFSKVVLKFEDGTSEEGADEENQEGAAEGAPGAATAAPQTADRPTPVPDAAGAAPEAAAPPSGDLGPITARVTGLVKRMLPLIGADAARADQLKSLAKDAQAAIQGQDTAKAETAANALEQAIAGFEAAPAGTQPAVDPAVLTKASTAWVRVRQVIDGELAKLMDSVRSTYQDHGGLAEIEKRVRAELDSVLGKLDDELAHKLDEISKAGAAEQPKLTSEAKQIVQRYQDHIATDKVLGALDENPFVPLSVQKTAGNALTAIARALH